MARRFANAKNINTQTSETTFSPDTGVASTPTMAGGTQAVAPEVGYAGSFTPQMSAPITFSVQGGGAVGAGKTVRGSRLGRGGPELTRPVSGSVTMGNVSISSTMSPTFSNIGNVDASVKGVTGATQTQTAPVSTTVGAPQVPKFAGVGGQTPKTPAAPTKKGFDLSTYDVTSQGGAGFGLKDIEYLRSQGVTDKQMQEYAQGLGPNVNFGKVAKETLGLGVTAPTPTGVRSTPGQRADTAQLESQMGRPTTPVSTVPTGPYAPGKGATPATTAALGQLKSQMSPTGDLTLVGKNFTLTQQPPNRGQQPPQQRAVEEAKAKERAAAEAATRAKVEADFKARTKAKQEADAKEKAAAKAAPATPAKAEQAKAKSQVVKAKESLKEAKSTPKEDRTKTDKKALEAARAKLQLEKLQAEKAKAERTKAEQRAVEEAKAKAKAAAEAAAKAKAKAQAAKKESKDKKKK